MLLTAMQNTLYNILFTQRAKVALDTLSSEEKDNVLQAIHRLETFGIEAELKEHNNLKSFHPDKSDEHLYLLRVNSTFRVIFKWIVPDRIEIIDIVMQDRLELFATHQN
ncbi:MAG TPA: hypothetical protein V6D28_13480 [Leptolyngbyaceae cyanobacterium]